MTRLAPLFLSLMLALGLAVSAGAAGYVRTAHGLARAGAMAVEICGQGDATLVTLDRFGQPLRSGECAHCADCTLVPLAVCPNAGLQATARSGKQFHFNQMTILPVQSRRVWRPSRGPPAQSKA